MGSVTIAHPTDRPNFAIVEMDGLGLAFSYATLVGIRVGFDPWKVQQNYWGSTTGKHLNYLNSDKTSRLDAEDFEEFVADMLEMMFA